ncbi:MAG TPA: hypothetical protein VLH39_07870, partial [Magnetospirillaceae bacterium]|nr:hypothetical protein [Magnetospirillaceae bacterium]
LSAEDSRAGRDAAADPRAADLRAADLRAADLRAARGGHDERLAAVRDGVFRRAAPRSKDRILVADARDGLLVLEALRRAPEGRVAVLARSERDYAGIDACARMPEGLARPAAVLHPGAEPDPGAIASATGWSGFDLILGRDVLAGDRPALLAAWARAYPEAHIVFAEIQQAEGGRLARIPGLAEAAGAALAERYAGFEDGFYSDPSRPAFAWRSADAASWLKAAGLGGGKAEVERYDPGRVLTEAELDAWFSSESAYGRALASAFSEEERRRLRAALARACAEGPVTWPFSVVYLDLPPRT